MNWKRPWNSARVRAQYFMTRLFSQSSPLSRLGPPLLIRFGRKTERKRETIVTLVIWQLQAQEATKRQEAIMASAEQTKPGNPSYFGLEEAGPESDKVLDSEGNRRSSTVAFAVAKQMRDGEVKQRTMFKIDQMTVREWIGINMKAFPLPFYASFGLMAAPPLGMRCRTRGKIHGREVCTFQEGVPHTQPSLQLLPLQGPQSRVQEVRPVRRKPGYLRVPCGTWLRHGKQDARLGSGKRILASYPPSPTASHRSARRVHQATHPRHK
jgi:hypothetical protein